MSILTDSQEQKSNNIIEVDFVNIKREEVPRLPEDEEGPMAFFDDEEWGN